MQTGTGDRERQLSSHSDAICVPAFSEDECRRIIAIGNTLASAKPHAAGPGGLKRLTQRVCSVASIPRTTETAWIHDRLYGIADDLNRSIWKFEIAGLEAPQFITYRFLNHFARHMDSGVPQFSLRKLTISVQLSEPSVYGGGNLHVWARNKERRASRKRGEAMVFPSHLWHRASPVWWGQRQALVAWITGTQALR